MSGSETQAIQPELLVPESDIEKQTVAVALYEERQRCERDMLVDSLTRREHLLIEAAWKGGADEARTALAERLRNPHAVTLDAGAVRQAIHNGLPSPPRIDLRRPGQQHHDPRIVGVVLSVNQFLEYEKQAR